MRRISVGLVMVAAIGAAVPVRAASIFEGIGTFGPTVFRLDPSARSRAMGGASGAVFWGDFDGWASPAVLGLARGLRYDQETTDFSAFEYEARRSVLGWGGLGLALAGRPFAGMGGLRLGGGFTIEYPGGEEVFQFEDEVESWSIGASFSNIATNIARMRGREPPALSRLADLAIGFSQKDIRGSSDPFVGPAIDWGLLVRTGSAFNARGQQGRIELAYGYSVQNADEESLRPHRHATALRLSLDPSLLSERRAALALQPLLSVGGAWDRAFITSDGKRVADETRLGAELGLADLAFVRFGEGPTGSVTTSGFGFALPIGRLARVRYDRSWSAVEDLPDVTTYGWSVWLDPLAIAEAWRHE
jgi:hypothetical protein